MVTRPRTSSQADAPANVPCLPLCGAGLTHVEWLATLKRGDMTRVMTHTGDMMPPATVTNYTPCFVFIGKLKFHRRNGWQVASQGQRVYRMRLRLVRDERDGI